MELLILVAILGGLAGGLTFFYRRLSAPTTLPVTAAWIDELSVDRYQPMLRLLGEDDFRFLNARAGSDSTYAAEFRRQRCQIFGSYLDCLQSDFQRVCMALKIIMVQSRYDRPDLAAVLVRTQRAFVFGLMSVHARVFLYRWGLASVDVAGLLKIFDGARLELRALVPAQLDLAA
ncbi:MAG TPA: hypothetical protein VKT49_23315 [Bryobacteraceae bacterium]|nr:hypothetical protein [Bryobacteraceae bacterium]